jgi:hypothetical protein
VGIGLDQTANALDGGSPDETISSRAAKEAMAGQRWGIVKEATINLLFAVAANERYHCEKSIEADEGEPIGPAR